MVFSLKSTLLGYAAFKLKKKLTSHRTAINKLDYNSNRQLVLSQSSEACILWNAATLTKEKTLNCSTSFFADSVFTFNGQYLINLFDDANVFFWCLDTFEHTETFVRDVEGKCVLAASRNQFLAVADDKKLFMTNFVYDKINFQEVDSNRLPGTIQQATFFDTLLLVRTSNGLYAGPVS
jgi:WD40 repeat protein